MALQNYAQTVLQNGITVETFWGTHLTKVRISDTNTGTSAVGNARLHPDDEFNLHVGVTLAHARATSRYYQKLEKKLVREPVKYTLLLR